jgi:TonB-linked SusC/RagA family outer membrane protein
MKNTLKYYPIHSKSCKAMQITTYSKGGAFEQFRKFSYAQLTRVINYFDTGYLTALKPQTSAAYQPATVGVNGFIKYPDRRITQIIVKMKMTVVILLIASIQVSATGFAQKITISQQNAPIEHVLKEIKKQTGYLFFYNQEWLKQVKAVNIDVKNASIDEVLDICFINQPVNYSIVDKTIILSKKENFTPVVDNFILLEIPPAEIKGVVTDAKGETLPGVSVRVKGTTTGTTTNTQGAFSLTVPDNATLVFSYIGFVNQEIEVNGRTSVNITLAEDRRVLGEVVVTALGVTKERKSLGYSVTEVKGEEFTEARSNNVAQSLTGKVAGLDATQLNSGPGGSSRVIMRGNTSLNNNQQPLYVINGMAINNWYLGARPPGGSNPEDGLNVDRGDGIASINADDIESISVLKGGAAAALYGSQAANGVILITTKSGKAQKGIGIDFNSNVVVGTPNEFPKYQYEYGSGLFHRKPASQGEAIAAGHVAFGAKMDGAPVVQFDGVLRPYSPVSAQDNIRNFYNNSIDATNTVAFSGGSTSTQFRLSLSDLRSKAIQPNSTYKRETANLSLKTQLGKNNFITIETNIQYNFENGKNRPTIGYEDLNAAFGVNFVPTNVDIRNLSPGYDPATGNEVEWNGWINAPNPYYVINRTGNSDSRQRTIGQAKIKFNILENLFIQGQVSRDFSYGKNNDFTPIGSKWTPLGYMHSSQQQDDKTVSQVNMNYYADFLQNFHVQAMAGGSMERAYSNLSTANGSQFIIPDFISLTNTKIINPANLSEGKIGTNSLFGSVDFDYKSLLYLSFTGREDWFSTLNPGFRNIFYPSVSTSFILSDAVKLPKIFSLVKLRAAWAQVGSATVAAGAVNRTFAVSSQNNMYGLPTLTNSTSLENPFIRPLTVTTSEGGAEVQLMNGRLGFDLTYYNKVTTNDILSPPISPFTGYTSGNQNMGKITNKGVELAINTNPIRKTNFSWNLDVNGSWNQSKIVSLAPGITTQSLGGGIINAIGLPYASVVMTNYLKDANGVQVYNKTSKYPVNFQDTLGVANPPWLMGISNEFRYKKFSLNVLVDGKFGAMAFSGQHRYAFRFGLSPETLADRETGVRLVGVDQTGAPFDYQWAPENMSTYYNQIGNAFLANSTYKTDFIKLRTLVFNYNIPIQKLKFVKIQSATFGVVARNLAILYQDKRLKSTGLDPELAESTGNLQGVVGTKMPISRQIGFNLNVKF